ncbi:Hypothetical protein LUCI_0840 [Lucifera butyrica]|uniref:UPF0102 protein LUCI_0840 n=1 Tax=Lucifera butyrica TaxID=1351585 RepID=A0A498R496_9FIRM|nr:YraN family protein [Lucifera butyrica]VBB05630.1 Hypothetical protein LUCI_0840 [Lucifera butyrica]
MNRSALGDVGEAAAAQFLSDAGYRILQRKYRTKTGEIDIIALDKRVLVFIEVKARRSTRYGTPSEAVDYYKQRKIINTALCYLNQTHNPQAEIRFDVVEVYLDPFNKGKCNHIINAFGD